MSWVSDSYREHKQKWLNFQPVELDPMLIRQRLGALSPETEWPNPHLEPVVAKRVRASAKRSAVAIILRDQPELPIVLTQRSAKIRFGGQWCFPGGREAGSDDSLRTAALRETEEEIGLLGEDMTWLGCLIAARRVGYKVFIFLKIQQSSLSFQKLSQVLSYDHSLL